MGILKDKNGKESSKRTWGTILLTIATVQAICAGFGWYEPIVELVNAMYYTGAGLLGLGTFETKK